MNVDPFKTVYIKERKNLINHKIVMEEKKKDKTEEETKKTELDKELDKTFPASDPPAHTRPGHNRDKDDKK